MEPAVPFALLGVVQLLAVVAWLGLAGTAVFPQVNRRAAPFVIAGAVALMLAETLTALRVGVGTWDLPPLLRVVGFGLLAVGLLGGALRLTGSSLGIVAPLGAAAGPAYAAGAVGVLAAGAALRRRRDAPAQAWALTAGLLLAAAAATVSAAAAQHPAAAVAELVLRGTSALVLLGVPVLAARTSVLTKVVAGILAGVVAMAAGAVGIVGTGVADEVQGQDRVQLAQVANGQRQSLADLATQSGQLATLTVAAFQVAGVNAAAILGRFASRAGYFAVEVPATGTARQLAGSPLGPAALQSLVGDGAVRSLLAVPATQAAATDTLVLPDRVPVVAVIGVASQPEPPGRRPSYVAVYGVRLGDDFAQTVHAQIGLDVTIIADGQVVASDLSAHDRTAVLAEARGAGVLSANIDPDVGRGLAASGDRPSVHFLPLQAGNNDEVQVATLAISRPAADAVAPQRSVLVRVFLTALVALLAVAVLAVALGRRIVDPVRRLTLAAIQVRRGDLDATSGVTSADEVGTLSRSFDSMTASVRTLTADLRDAADEEAALRGRLETVLGSMSDGLVATDADDVVTGVNATAAALLGVDAAAAVGRPLADVADVRDAAGRPLFSGAYRAAGGRFEAAGTVPAEGRPGLPVQVAVAPLEDGRGHVIVLRDTTREREVERLKTEFLSNVSHELRTPLTPIRGYAEVLRRRGITPEQVHDFAGIILSASQRMERVVGLLVDIAALDAGRVRAEPNAVSVRTVVEGRLAAWKVRWPERAGDFRRRVASGLPAVQIDERWLA
ncbi:MAG TPA: histidine kinase dimerization/phospho-acceptor domain-containing protein, partial [Mycobacteriales bacterium]|nr:histidine kinase dimerization/phospho-acceptor domain-containing protein [Mycobacteriales bacterium]